MPKTASASKPQSIALKKSAERAFSETRAGAILKKAGLALATPGISRSSVFRTKNVYAYSLDPTDPTRIVREDSSRRKVVGKVIGGRFRALSTKK